MFKPENPFQQFSDFIIGNNNECDYITTMIEDGVNNIAIYDDCNIDFIYKDFNNRLFIVYDIEVLIDIISKINFNIENKIELSTYQENKIYFNDTNLKISIIISIIYLVDFYTYENYPLFKNIFNNLLPKYYKNVIDCLDDYILNYNEDRDYVFDERSLDNLYYLIFNEKDNLEFILNYDKELLLKLLTMCYSNMTKLNFIKTMNSLNFDYDFVDCIHNCVFKNKIENDGFKQFFNLE